LLSAIYADVSHASMRHVQPMTRADATRVQMRHVQHGTRGGVNHVLTPLVYMLPCFTSLMI